jgi:hypothetical protein
MAHPCLLIIAATVAVRQSSVIRKYFAASLNFKLFVKSLKATPSHPKRISKQWSGAGIDQHSNRRFTTRQKHWTGTNTLFHHVLNRKHWVSCTNILKCPLTTMISSTGLQMVMATQSERRGTLE